MKKINNPMPALSPALVATLQGFIREGNGEIRLRVTQALLQGEDIVTENDSKKKAAYIQLSLDSFNEKYVAIALIHAYGATPTRDNKYVELIASLYKRTPKPVIIEALKLVYIRGQTQLGTSTMLDIAQPNICRACKTFEETEKLVHSFKKLTQNTFLN
jgi:hypothetical protein